MPEAFVVTTACFRAALTGELRAEIGHRLAAVTGTCIDALDVMAASIRELVVADIAGHGGDARIRAAYRELCRRAGRDDLAVALLAIQQLARQC